MLTPPPFAATQGHEASVAPPPPWPALASIHAPGGCQWSAGAPLKAEDFATGQFGPRRLVGVKDLSLGGCHEHAVRQFVDQKPRGHRTSRPCGRA